jgi:hypothetical protein
MALGVTGANGGVIGPTNSPVQSRNNTTFTSSAPGGHTFHPATQVLIT